MNRFTTKAIKYTQAVLISLIVLVLPSGQLASALDDNVDCDFFTGHCTGGGPYDEPPDRDPDDSGPEPLEPQVPSTSQPPVSQPPPASPPVSSPSPNPDDGGIPPICSRKPSLPQCN